MLTQVRVLAYKVTNWLREPWSWKILVYL